MTIAEKITRAKADYDAVYEAGKAQGGGKPTLYGTYAIKENIMGDKHFVTETFKGKGVNAYFYDPRIKEYVNLEVADFYIGTSSEGLYWITDFDENNLRLSTSFYYSYQGWESEVIDFNWDIEEFAHLPDAKGRLVIFSEPTVVSEQFYNRFKEISDTSEDIFGEGYDKAYGEVEYLNDELATSLYGGDTGYKGYYDEFWDSYQNNGALKTYEGAFAGRGWTKQTFKPKYDIRNFLSAANMFWSNLVGGDLVEILNDLNITIDSSRSTNASNMFAFSGFTRIGVIDLRKATTASGVFNQATNLVTIDKVITSADTNISTNWFGGCNNLENVIFEGEISKKNLDLQWSTKLSKASIISIINCLSTSTSGLSVTLSETAVKSAFGSTTSDEWNTLIDTRKNWTISLA